MLVFHGCFWGLFRTRRKAIVIIFERPQDELVQSEPFGLCQFLELCCLLFRPESQSEFVSIAWHVGDYGAVTLTCQVLSLTLCGEMGQVSEAARFFFSINTAVGCSETSQCPLLRASAAIFSVASRMWS